MGQIAKLAAAGLLALIPDVGSMAASPVEPQALNALFPGEFEAVVHGYAVSFTAHENGALVGRHESETDTGQWSIQENQLCITMSSWLNGRTICRQVIRVGEWYQAGDVLFRQQ